MIWEIILIVYILLLVWLIFNIILDYDNRNPVKTISWIFAIIFIPLLGMLAYYIVGRNIRKKRSKTKKLRDQFNKQHKHTFRFDKNNPEYSHYTELQKLIYNLEHVPVLPGNHAEVYPSGKVKFEHLLKDVDEAKEHIHIFYFIIGDNVIGCKLKDLLIKKVKEGINVRLIYDGLGSSQTNLKYFNQMKDIGVDVRTFLPLNFFRILHSINYRNHRKIVIIDGKVAYTGGINVKDEYVDGLEWGKWNDSHFKIEGPAAQALQSVFLADWYYVSGEYLSSDKFYPVLGNVGNSPVQIVNGEPFGLHSNILEAIFVAITRAKKSVYIETPYFIPTSNLLSAIQTAAMSGIDVRLLIPGRSDSGKVQYASNTYIECLLRNNVKVYRYAIGFTHSKLMIIDDELVIAGSSNLDIRSLELHFETNIFIYDVNIAQTVKEIYFKDLADSEEVNLEQWINRPKRIKFKEACFRLASPLF
ncbi:MAG: cardiolipin synthase [Tannerella sp.]|jgi:cardiolipin synthase|nr:cardiolipin synthase [Tannerella sp.]